MPPNLNQNPAGEMPTGDKKVPTIRTYKSDVAEFIKKEGKTLADIAIAEEKRITENQAVNIGEPEKREWGRKVILISLGLVVLAALTFGGIVIFGGNKIDDGSSPEPETTPAMFLGTIDEKSLDISGLNEISAISAVKNALKDQSSPFYILSVEARNTSGKLEKLPARNFLETVDIYPPADLIRSMKKDYAVGSLGGKSVFLILKNSYYANTFAGMYQWEDTMAKDLSELLNLPKFELATATPENSSGFVDIIANNRDIRALRDKIGRTVLLYSFIDKETIVIAPNETALKAVSDKLAKTK